MRNFPTLTIGNSDLKAETSDYVSLCAEYHGDRWDIGVTGFANWIHDMIVKEIIDVDADALAAIRRDFPEITDAQATKISHYNRYVNSDRGRVYGLRPHVTYSPIAGLSLTVNYSCILGQQESDGVWQNLERSIRNTLTLAADIHHLSLHVRVVSWWSPRHAYFTGSDFQEI